MDTNVKRCSGNEEKIEGGGEEINVYLVWIEV